MSQAMIMRAAYNANAIAPVGVGQISLDVQNYVASALKPQIDAAKAEVLSEVKRQGDEAKRIAIIGGIVAGLAGVGIGIVVARKLM